MNRLEPMLRLNASGARPDDLRTMLQGRSADELLAADACDWAQWGMLAPDLARRLQARAISFDASGELERLAALEARILSSLEPDYPDLLRCLPQAPFLLYSRGTLGHPMGAVALVGSRRPTPYGRRMARRLAGETAAAGGIVVSGLARGIDGEAHEAALAAGGRTWAVLGSGLARVYPAEHGGLCERIVDSGGCVLSEFPTLEPPSRENFPRRNRIVSGLSWATVVVEGEAHSGALITARLAAEQGREVFAVPGPADSPLSQAPHILMEQGARPIRSMAEVWETLPPGARPLPVFSGGGTPAPETPGAGRPLPVAETHKKILEFLGSDALTMEELAGGLGLPLSGVSGDLLKMELKGIIVPVAGQRYAKR